MTFCSECGGVGFCQSHCSASSPQVKYHQRTMWYLGVMADTSDNVEQREYWLEQLSRERGREASQRKGVHQ
jgi:hypothetical protein